MYTQLVLLKLIFLSLPTHDADQMTQKWGEFLPNIWQDVSQKVGKELSLFLPGF
jgi:hypothetical protein